MSEPVLDPSHARAAGPLVALPHCEQAAIIGPLVGRPAAEGLLQLAYDPVGELLRRREHLESGTLAVSRHEPTFGLGELRVRHHVLDALPDRCLVGDPQRRPARRPAPILAAAGLFARRTLSPTSHARQCGAHLVAPPPDAAREDRAAALAHGGSINRPLMRSEGVVFLLWRRSGSPLG